ncbi:substrate-binding domain-containing protein [bacterium]|nr:substrate-binding domain-containing protein [bacterium]
MDSITLLTGAEQVAGHLREALLRGELSGTIPGVRPLAAELGVNHKTVEVALKLLEDEGLLVDQGPGRRRKIMLPENHAPPALRVAVLDIDVPGQNVDYMIDLRHRLVEAGHVPFFAGKTLEELGMNVGRVARFVTKTKADAWVVSVASREVLRWFTDYEKPAFALFGRRSSLPIAGIGPDHVTAWRLLTRRLITLGHQRIVTLIREHLRVPEPSPAVRAMLAEMQASGLATSSYNLPDWEETREGFHRVLDGLFQVTAPTALIFDEPLLFHAAKHHLAHRGFHCPAQVSLVCAEPDPTFAWCLPTIAHFNWDYRPVVRRVVRWADNVARGKEDRRQTLTKIDFVEGGTIGPVVKT